MTDTRWKKIEEIYHLALRRDQEGRGPFLDQACAGDGELRRQVDTLLALAGEAEGFLNEPLLQGPGAAHGRSRELEGRSIGSYRIRALAGAGGMGEVYEAEDTRLRRRVALKFLPDFLDQDEPARQRFLREARSAAALDHPHICQVHAIETVEDLTFIVMEYVEGRTLRERLENGALPLQEALEICLQITEGLEAAHEKGILHRDLKPSNIKLTPDGRVKILDFGLAKPLKDTAGPAAPTGATEEMTVPGLILGTAAYMAPEQARGEPVDRKADIWAFGCVMYECLTGRQAFSGGSVTEILAKVLEAEPDWAALPAETPPVLLFLLKRCLEKEPRRRVHDIADLRIALEKAAPGSVSGEPAGGRAERLARSIVWPVLAVILLLSCLLLLWRDVDQASAPSAMVKRYTLKLNPSPATPPSNRMALSPDGGEIVYAATDGLYRRSLDSFEGEASRILGSEPGARLSVSPDGRWIAYISGGVKRIAREGGAAFSLIDDVAYGLSWGPDDTVIVASANVGLVRVPYTGGQSELLLAINREEGERSYWWPEVLADGRAVLFEIRRGPYWGPWWEGDVAALSLETGEQKTVLEGGSFPRYTSTGHILYSGYETVMAAPFDPVKLETTGDAVPVLQGVATPHPGSGALFWVSREGTVVYVPSSALSSRYRLVWLDRDGNLEVIQELDWFPHHPFTPSFRVWPRFSPDGRHVAVVGSDIEAQRPYEEVFWIVDLVNKTREIVPGGHFIWPESPVWSPDGGSLFFGALNESGGQSLWQVQVDGTGSSEAVTVGGPGVLLLPTSWHPDASVLLANVYLDTTNRVEEWVKVQALSGETDLHPGEIVAARASHARFSPSGEWIAYTSRPFRNAPGDVWIRPYPGPGNPQRISTQGGAHPIWSPDGSELFYLTTYHAPKLMVVSVQVEPVVMVGTPRVLIDPLPEFFSGYDIAPDGKRFIVTQFEEKVVDEVRVIVNWFDELKRLVPTKW